MGCQVFEFKNTVGKLFKILPENKFKVIHQRIPLCRGKVSAKKSSHIRWFFSTSLYWKNYRLLHYLKKELAQAREEAITAPTTCASEGPLPTWIDRSFLY